MRPPKLMMVSRNTILLIKQSLLPPPVRSGWGRNKHDEASEADDGVEGYDSVDKTVPAPSTSKKRTRKKHRHVRTRKSHNEQEAEKRAEEKKGGSRLVANAMTRVCEGNDRSCLCDWWSGYLRPSVCKQGKWNQRPLQCWNEQFGFWQALQKTEFSHWQITAVYELVDQE